MEIEADFIVSLELLHLRVHFLDDVVLHVALLFFVRFLGRLDEARDEDDEVWLRYWGFYGGHLVWMVQIRNLVFQQLGFHVLEEIWPCGFVLGTISTFSSSVLSFHNPFLVSFFVG